MMRLQSFLRSMKHAVRGVRVVFESERSFRVQAIIAVFVLILAAMLKVTSFEWIILLLLIGLVLILELINSIFERVVDSFKPRMHPIVGEIKDMMAGAVLLASLIALAVGIIIFYPYLLDLVGLTL